MAQAPVIKKSLKEKQTSINSAISVLENKPILPDKLYITVTKTGIEDMTEKIDKPYYKEDNEKVLQPYYEGSFYTIKELAGLPYEKIIKYLNTFKTGAIQDLFRRSGVSEILTKEVCACIGSIYMRTGAEMIYFHNAGAGAESLAFKQSGILKDCPPPIRVFDKYPEKSLYYDYYDDVIKMNIKDKIIFEEDLDKRILVVSVAPLCSMRNDILEGMKKNKDNYVGILFIGEIIKGLNMDDDLHYELGKIDYDFASFNIFPSVSSHDIYDEKLNKLKIDALKIKHTSNQLFFVNQNINESFIVNIDNFMMLNSIHTLPYDSSLISCMLEHTYFMNMQGILWDMSLEAFANLNIMVHFKIENPELTPDGIETGKPIPLDVIIAYYKAIKRIKYQINILLYMRQSLKPPLLSFKNLILPSITYKTDTLYKQQLYNFVEDKCRGHEYYHRMICQVCIKKQKYICTGCGVNRYCSEQCRQIDWKYLGHKHECRELKKCRIELDEQLKTDQDRKAELYRQNADIRKKKIKEKKLKKKALKKKK